MEDHAAHVLTKPHVKGHVGFKRRPAATDEVVADMRLAVGGCTRGGRLAGPLDHREGQLHLPLSRGHRDPFNGLALLVATEKIHAAVDARGIAPEGVFDQTDALEDTRASRSPNTGGGW